MTVGKLLKLLRPNRDDELLTLEDNEETFDSAPATEPELEAMKSCVRVMETADPADTDVLYVIETDSEFRFHKPTGVRTVKGWRYRFTTVCGKQLLDPMTYPLQLIRSLEPLKVADIGEESSEAPLYICETCLPGDFIVPLVRLIDDRLVAMVEPTPARLVDLGMTPIDGGREWVRE